MMTRFEEHMRLMKKQQTAIGNCGSQSDDSNMDTVETEELLGGDGDGDVRIGKSLCFPPKKPLKVGEDWGRE